MLDVDIRKNLGEIHVEAAFRRETEGVTAVFGVSGAGKTSVINMIAGLITPDSGHINFNGKIFFDSDRKINMPGN
ncbi:MAG: ATP-binding cassette domain-containing protein, partial [Mucispirillum sp.]|nr:ATP-binding cassette domain-containing protein [Mucispirillum sp.]